MASLLVVLLTLTLATSAAAIEPPEPEEPFEWPGPVNSFLVGLNSIITAPADPFASAIWPGGDLDELPLGVVTSHVAGFVGGTLLCVWRVVSGPVEMLLAPLPSERVTPEPRYEVIPAIEW